MNNSSCSRSGAVLSLSGLCICILSLTLYGAFLRPDRIDPSPRGIWSGYRVLLVESSIPAGEVERRLSSAGSGEVLSRSDVFLTYCEYPGLGEVPLEGLAHRFDDADPRYDSYMRSVGNYFTSRDGRYSLYYCEETGTSLSDIADEAFTGTPVDYHLLTEPEVDGSAVRFRGIVTAAVILLFGLLLGVIVKKYISVIIISALVCAGVGFFTGVIVLPAALFYQFASAFVTGDVLTRYKRRLNEGVSRERGGRRWVPPLIALGAGLGSSIGGGGGAAEVMTLILLALAVTAIPVIRAGVLVFAQSKREHRLFFSIPLRREKKAWGHYRKIAVASLIGMAFLVGMRFLTPFESSGSHGLSRASVVPLPGETLEPGDLDIVPGEPPESSQLPDLRHYLQHRSYQELYLYGGRSSLSTFTVEEGRIVKRPEDRIAFDEEWVRDRSAEFAVSPLGKLLLSDSGPLRAVYSVPIPPETEEAVPIFTVIIWLGVALAAGYGSNPLTAAILYGMKSIEPRRRRQAA